MNGLKVGDRVYYRANYAKWYVGFGKVVSVFSDRVHVDPDVGIPATISKHITVGNLLGEEVVLEELYDTPLFKALR